MTCLQNFNWSNVTTIMGDDITMGDDILNDGTRLYRVIKCHTKEFRFIGSKGSLLLGKSDINSIF